MAHKYLSSVVGDLKYAYSFKKVVSGYSGNCIEVRRASDDTTSNIGFDGDDLDASSLNTFLGGSNGYVKTWYDQTGTVNLVQATNADQPQLVLKDGEYTCYFDGSSATMQLENGASLTTATNSILHTVWRAPADYTTDLADDPAGFQFGSTAQQFKPWGDTGNAPQVHTTGPEEIQTNGVWDDGQWRQHHVAFFNGTCTPYEMGSKIFDAASRTNPDMAHFYVGGNNTDAASMWVTEVCWFDAVKSPEQIWWVTKNNYETNLFSYTDFFLHIGDSISSGTRAGNGNEWMLTTHSTLGTDRWHTRGYSGYSLTNWNDNQRGLVHFGRDQNLTVSGTRCAIIFAGTNDMASVSDGTETFAQLEGLVRALKNNRFGLIGVITTLPGDPSNRGASFEARRTVYNNLIRANTNGLFDFIVDTDTNSNLTDYTNTTYFNVDGVHLNATGAAEVGTMVYNSLNALTLSSYAISGDDMGITFALRGDSVDARYSSVGKTPGYLGSTNDTAVTTDQAGINGTNSIDMAGSGAAIRPLIYNGRQNTPDTLNRSILLRAKFGATANLGLFNIGTMTRNPSNYIGANIDGSGEIIVYTGSTDGATDSGTTTSAGLGTTAWHDIVVTWDGQSNLDIWVDGTRRLNDTGIFRQLPSPFNEADQLGISSIILGQNFVTFNTQMFVDEFVIWDEIIDVSAVTLTSGSGALNGASRSAYVDVASYDGLASSGSGGSLGLGGFGV